MESSFHKGSVGREITNDSLGFKKEDTCFYWKKDP